MLVSINFNHKEDLSIKSNAFLYSGIPYSVNDKGNFSFCREAPYSGYRGFLGWGIQILMEASSPKTGRTSKWPISKMAARIAAEYH